MSEVVVKKTLTVPNKLGLHAKPVGRLVRVLQPFKCKVTIAKGDSEINGRSVLGLMMLAAEFGSKVTITLVGPDAPAAMEAVEELFSKKFYDEPPFDENEPLG